MGQGSFSAFTFQEEVSTILAGRPNDIGLVNPLWRPAMWLPGYTRRFVVEVGGDLTKGAVALARSAGFACAHSPLPGRCGASTARVLLLPDHGNAGENETSALHELTHGVGKRLGTMGNEADWWFATAAVARAMVAAGRDPSVFAPWFVESVERFYGKRLIAR